MKGLRRDANRKRCAAATTPDVMEWKTALRRELLSPRSMKNEMNTSPFYFEVAIYRASAWILLACLGTLLSLGSAMFGAKSAYAQTFTQTHSESILLAGGGNDLANTLKLMLGNNTDGGLMWTINPANKHGLFINDGSGSVFFDTLLPAHLALPAPFFNGNTDIDALPNLGGLINIGNATSTAGDSSTTTLYGYINVDGPISFNGPVTLPGGSFADSSISLTDDKVLIGNSSNQATARTITQDVSINDTGLATVVSASGPKFTVTGNEHVIGSDTIGGNQYVSGSDTITGNLDVKGNFNIGGATSHDTVSGNVTFTGPTINFTVAPTFPGGSFADSSISLTDDKVLIGNTGNQAVARTITQDVTINETGLATVVSASGPKFTVTGNEHVVGSDTIGGNQYVNGSDTITGNLDVKGNFNIGGATSHDTVGGNVVFTGPTIKFNVAPTFPGGSFADSSISLTDDKVLIGNTGNQAVARTITQDVTINDTGAATVVSAHGNFSVGGSEHITGADTVGTNSIVGGYQTITGGQQVGGNDTVIGNLYANSNFNIGGSTSHDTVGGNVVFTGPTIKFNVAPTFPGGSFADSSISLTDDKVLIGNTGNQAVARTITQDVTINDTGLATVVSASGTKFTVNGYQDVLGGQHVSGADTVGGTFTASGNVNLDTTTGSGGTITIGNTTSTTKINGTVTFSSAPSLPLTQNYIYVGNNLNVATPLAPTANKVLTTDGSGNVSWGSASATELFARSSGDNNLATNSTTLVADPSLQLSLSSAGTYEFSGVIAYDANTASGSTAADLQIAMHCSSDSIIRWSANQPGTAVSPSSVSADSTAISDFRMDPASKSNTQSIFISGIVVTKTSGSFTLQVLESQGTSQAAVTTIRANSFIRAIKVQ